MFKIDAQSGTVGVAIPLDFGSWLLSFDAKMVILRGEGYQLLPGVIVLQVV